MWTYLNQFRNRAINDLCVERGQGLVEYALILMLVGIVVIIALALFGDAVRGQYCEIVYSVDPNADVGVCNTVDVDCIVTSSNPFQMRAQVNGGVAVERVSFYVDGKLVNEEYQGWYCLGAGDGPCQDYTNSGSHTFTAIAHTEDGETGQCSIKATVP